MSTVLVLLWLVVVKIFAWFLCGEEMGSKRGLPSLNAKQNLGICLNLSFLSSSQPLRKTQPLIPVQP